MAVGCLKFETYSADLKANNVLSNPKLGWHWDACSIKHILIWHNADRISVSCSTLSLRLDSNDYCRMLLGSKTQHVRKAYFVFVKIWITTNRMVLGWSSNLTLVTSTPRINRMALGWLGSWRLWRKPLSEIQPFYFFLDHPSPAKCLGCLNSKLGWPS